MAEDGSGEEWLRRLQRKRTRGEKEKVGRENEKNIVNGNGSFMASGERDRVRWIG